MRTLRVSRNVQRACKTPAPLLITLFFHPEQEDNACVIALTCLALTLGSVAPATQAASPHWEAIRAGNSPAQVTKSLGAPLMKNAARGYERWIYDSGAEVQFEGGVVKGWTAPVAPEAPARVVAIPTPIARRERPAPAKPERS